jgi:hypothetical protein
MRDWTLDEIETRINDDLDLHEENFISASEKLAKINAAIDRAESLIHTIYEDYFLSYDTLTLVDGTAAYDMPSDIYANKLRRVLYNVEGEEYTIKYLRGQTDLQRLHLFTDEDRYKYLITNTAGAGRQMVFYPTPAEDGAYITRWYIRNAKRLVNSSDVLDIPEFADFIIESAKGACMAKEYAGTIPPTQAAIIKQLEADMIDTLTAMVPDGETQLEADLSFYEDHV